LLSALFTTQKRDNEQIDKENQLLEAFLLKVPGVCLVFYAVAILCQMQEQQADVGALARMSVHSWSAG
jgi:hypothetical protein